VIDEGRKRRVSRRNDGPRQRAGGRSRLDGSDHERRPPTGADSEHRISRRHRCVGDSQSACLRVVFGSVPLGSGSESRAGDDRRDPSGCKRERRLALGRVERGDRSRGACTDVQQPAAALETRDDRVDRLGDLRRRLANGRSDELVLVVHELDELV